MHKTGPDRIAAQKVSQGRAGWANAFAVFFLILTLNNIFPASGLATEVPGPAVVLDGNTRLDLTPFLKRVHDPEGRWQIQDIIALPDTDFTPLLHSPAPGYTRDIIWYRTGFHIQVPDTPSDGPHFIEMSPAFLDQIDIFLIDPATQEPVWQNRTGDNNPITDDSVISPRHAVALPDLVPGDYTLVFRVKSKSTHLFEARIKSDAALISDMTSPLILSGFYFGILLVTALIYFWAGMLIRDFAIIWYAIYVFSVATVLLGMSGLSLIFVTPIWPAANDIMTGGGVVMSVASSAIMWATIMRSHKIHRGFHLTFWVYGMIVATFVLISTSDYFIYFGRIVLPVHLIMMFVLLGCLLHAAWRSPDQKILIFYVLALCIPITAAMIFILTIIGILPTQGVTLNVYQVGSILHLIMMGIVMGYRTHLLERERIAAVKNRIQAHHLAREQGEFIAMLAHEFRTPLAIIRRAVELIQLRIGDAGQGTIDRLERIREHGAKLSGLVDVFLTKETLDRATFAITRRPVIMPVLLTSLVAAIKTENPELPLTLEDGGDAVIDADQTLLELAIGNIIENARKYAPGSPIKIDCHHRGDNFTYLRIADFGPGMSNEELTQVTHAFFRGKTAGNTSGVGLGLHITSRIVEAHGGTMMMTVGEKGGTTVLLKLPINRALTITRIQQRKFAESLLSHANLSPKTGDL
ncbi:sensor histidine kinase [Thalassospira sp.]|uniref:sensor histidine kinase n=1 Tax=Thalassospira sp. TaxID=1912094 RepID=UPI002737100D|nr:sensor histidine kinase [Thalassospira sp.]MDP2697105.1 sensor histidine kinase [Thalassospira sp.]